jgi:hypothetical protein
VFATALPLLGGIGLPELIIVAFLILPLNVLPVWFLWRVVSKTGRNPWMSLLYLIPAGEFVLLALLAFQEWPALKSVPGDSALAAPMAPSGWLSDPTGRYESRYWDGAAWTAAVFTAGEKASDPV